MIPIINDIQEMYHFTGFDHQSISADFDIITHQETYPSTYKMVPAHRRDFYSIIFLESQQESEMLINQNKHQQLNDILFFQSPQHVFSFVRGDNMKGFLIFFKPSFLLPFVKDIFDQFSFFRSDENNLFHLNSNDKKAFITLFNTIIADKMNPQVVKGLLFAMLEKAKILQQKSLKDKTSSIGDHFIHNFKRLINNHFIEEKSVDYYAKQLNLTANYLNNKIKNETGKTAKEHISERIVLEAKNMLLYTGLDITEISYRLNFTENSYFGKFFKKHTQQTPKEFRLNR